MKNLKLIIIALLFLLFAENSFSQTIYGKAKSELCIIYSCIPENFTYAQALQEMRIIYSCIPKNFTYTETSGKFRVIYSCIPKNFTYTQISGKMRVIYSCIPPNFIYQSYEFEGFEINETCPPQPADLKILDYDIIPLSSPLESLQKFRLEVLVTSNTTCYATLLFKDYSTSFYIRANETKELAIYFDENVSTESLTRKIEISYPLEVNESDNKKTIVLYVQNPPNVLKANETYDFSASEGKIIASVDLKSSDVWTWIEIEENDDARGMSIKKIVRQDGKVIERWFRIGNKVYIFDDPSTYIVYYVKPYLPVVAYETSLFIAVLISLAIGIIVSLRTVRRSKIGS